MISLDNVSKTYSDKTVLSNVSFSISSPGFYSIVGPSGSGKTTLLSLICGFEKPSEGTIKVEGAVGYVFQESNLIPDFSALDNIKIVGVGDEKATELLKIFGLEECANKKASLLSGGEKQRVAVARSLAMDSNILILDEPTGSLDEENAKHLFKLLKEISKGIIVLVVTHDKDLANEYSDCLIAIDAGKIAYQGEKATKQIEAHKKENKILKGFSFKYALSLVKERKAFSAFSIVLMILTLILEFFSFDLIMFNGKEVMADAASKANLPYICLTKTAYNENDMTEYHFSRGKIASDEIESLTGLNVSYSSTYVAKSERNNVTTKYNCLIVDDDYEFSISKGAKPLSGEAVITDFLAKFLYGEEDPIGKDFETELGNFTISGIEETSFDQADYEKYYLDASFQESHEEYISRYINLFVGRKTITDRLYSDGNISLKGGNFSFSDKGSQTFTTNSSWYARGSIVPGLRELKDNEVILSSSFVNQCFNEHQDEVVGSEYSYLDLNKSINKNKLLDSINLYDIYPSVKVVDVVDMSYDVAISDSFFQKIVEESIAFKFGDIAVAGLTKAKILNLLNHDFILGGNAFYWFSSIKETLDSVKTGAVFVTALIVAIVVLTSILLLSSIISRKMHEIATLKCLGATNSKLFAILSIFSLFAFLSSYFISFVLSFFLRIQINAFINAKLLSSIGIVFELFPFSFPAALIVFGLSFVLALSVVTIPMAKVSKIEPAILLKKTL